jgi:ATP/maltotriose-dependent transcriptional regulator MalT
MHTLSGFASGQPGLDLPAARELMNGALAGIDGTKGHPMLALVAAGAAMIADDPGLALREIEHNLVHPDPWARAALTLMRAALGENSGDVAMLRRDGQSGYDQFSAIGDRWGMATCLSSLGWVRMIDGDLDGSIAAYERSIELVRELRAGDDVTEQLLRLGAVRARAGDLAGARRDILSAQEQVERRHSAFMQAFVAFGLGEVYRQEGDLAAARAQFDKALGALDTAQFGPPQVQAIVMTGMAALDLAAGDVEAGRAQLRDALDTAFRAQDMPIVAGVLVGLACHAQAVDAPARTATLLAAATAVRGAEDRSDREAARLAEWARSALGPREYAEAHSRGLRMSRAEARAFAEGDPVPAGQARRR